MIKLRGQQVTRNDLPVDLRARLVNLRRGIARSFAGMLALGILTALGTVAEADTLPVPPVPPLTPPRGAVAPTPNTDLSGPNNASGNESPALSVKLYRARPYDPGLGFAPGSRYQSSEDRKPIQTPGLSFSVPLK